VRTTESTITFRRPFTLSALDKAQPAGTYRVVTEEEEIDGLSFVAFRRTATLLHLPVWRRQAPRNRSSPSIRWNGPLSSKRTAETRRNLAISRDIAC